ncbi:MAG: sugar kinase [Clostridia bacterium]|nr:sugar kinase [Clostridia bacterium]
MQRNAKQRIVLVTQKTRLENLVYRYNTIEQVKFYLECRSGDFEEYRTEHETYREALNSVVQSLERFGRVQCLDREYISSFLFGEDDLVVALGRDGLVANVLKYLERQKLIGVNSDPRRWDGYLVPFTVSEVPLIAQETLKNLRKTQIVTLAQATLNDGQSLCGVNDIFIGQKSHVSARYELRFAQQKELQCSSGIIVSTGLGKTGWLKSVLAGAGGVDRYFGLQGAPQLPQEFQRDSAYLYYAVREPYASTSTGDTLVFGKVDAAHPLQITSHMAENGVIFSDGVEEDYLQFNAGSVATVAVAEKQGHLVV